MCPGQELHCDAGFRIGQALSSLTDGCRSAAYYVGDGSPEFPSMRTLAAATETDIARRMSDILGCPGTRLAALKKIDRAGFNIVKQFLILLWPAGKLRRVMTQHDMDAGDLICAGGPLCHSGAGCEEGKLRLVAFRTFADPYDYNAQHMRFMLLIYCFEWNNAVKECLMMHWRGSNPAMHFSNAPLIADAIYELVDAERSIEFHSRQFIEHHGLNLFRAYMATHPFLKKYFDPATGKLLSET